MSKILRFKVYSPPHTKFAALHLVEQLKKLGHNAAFTEKVNITDSSIYVLYNATSLTRFPKKYIVYQTEIHGTHFFNQRYLRIIKGALAVWEYCSDNLHCYNHPKISIVTPGISPQRHGEKDIDLLFYGWIKGSKRRDMILSELLRKTDIEIVTNKLCHDIWGLLKRTKTVINVHYYDHSPLEVFRINEALSFGCDVISEGYTDRYAGNVMFCDHSEIWEYIKKPVQKSKDLSNLDNLLEVKAALDKL